MQKTKRGKSAIPADRVKALEKGLERLKSSPRFEMLRGVPVSQFLPPGSGVPEIERLPLSELVDMGALKICRLASDSPATVKAVTEFIDRLTDESVADTPPVEDVIVTVEVEGFDRPVAGTPFFGSTKEELRLTNAVQRLKSSDRFDRLRSRVVGDFWDARWVSAPFEQCLTFKQLSELDIEALLKKRSFNALKIEALVGAIERALDASAIEPATRRSTVTGELRVPAPDRDASSAGPRWMRSETWPSHISALLCLAEGQAVVADRATSPLARLYERLPVAITPLELVSCWLSLDHPSATVASLLDSREGLVRDACDRGGEKIAAGLRELCPEVSAHWEGALAGPGVTLQSLLAPYLTGLVEPEFENAVARMALRGMGAVNATVFGRTFPMHWTKSAKILELMLNGFLATLPKSDGEVRSELSSLFPNFPFDDLVIALRERARLDDKKKVWQTC